ncbi:hypothetical protein Vadar_011188 [Vaccinium darrowii]|uniref:Uncharacterized protein n=1 Tax=Vaccinium darrowii TaxID=229202 RepID=A0ACB7XI05_9ERIC|nr:hypothetical protein Vadar_011188 [Vaccinium darrowii]
MNPLTVRNLKELAKFHSPDCIFLMESRNHFVKIDAVRKVLGFSKIATVEPIGIGGGLCLMWKQSVEVEILERRQFFLEAVVKDGSGLHCWRVYFVHAPAEGYAERRVLWQDLKERVSRVRQNCILLGDFNAITSNEEKWGGPNRASWELRDFREFISESHLIDMGYVGYPFTWNNKRHGGCNVRERLDRALVNSSWRIKYPNGVLHHLRPMGSDHCPILVDSDGINVKSRQRFVFDKRWCKEGRCREVIARAWNTDVRGSRWFKVQTRIKCCRVELLKWRKLSGLNSGKRIRQLQEVLDQRSKEEFFDAEGVKGIEDSNGVWKEDPGDISRVVLEYFKDIFASEGALRLEEVVRCVKRCVPHEMNMKLIRPISAAEENLRQRGVLSTSGCSLCGSPEESVLHIAAYCPFARAVWFSSPLQIDSQVLAGCSFINWWAELMCRGQGYHDQVVWKASAAYLLWGIWKSRNRAKFDHARIDPVWTMQHAMGCAAEFLKVHKEKERVGVNISAVRTEGQVLWESPPPGMVKINFDGAFVPNLKVGGVGVVARADDGSFLFARSCGGLKARSAIVMEGLALRVGVLLAKDQGIRRVVFEGDAKGLIDMLNGKPAGCEDIQLLVMDILQLCSSFFDDFSFVFVGRVCNVVAHELAKKGCSLGSCSTWLVIPPLWLWDLVCREKCSCT